MGKRIVDRETWMKIMRMREEGYSYRRIANELDLPISTVHYSANNVPKHDYDPRAYCGTKHGYYMHRRRGERACIPCCDANAAAVRAYRQSQKSHGL